MARTTSRVTFNNFPKIAAALPKAAAAVVEETVEEIYNDIVADMQAAKSGRSYGVRGLHTASAPGESPAIDSGELVSSLDTDVQGTQGAVYTDDPKSVWLEYGTSRMAARPFMTPAAERARPGFERKLADLESKL